MQNIMNMTVGQMLHGISNHIAWLIVVLPMILSFEAIVRQVAVNKGYKNVVSWCDRIAGGITFIIDVLDAAAKKKVVPVILICAALMSLTGCSTAILKTGCGHLTGTEVTIPYVGGKADGNAYGCYMGCVGFNCPKQSTADMATIMSAYVANAAKDNVIKTVDGGTVTYQPPAK